MEKTIGIFKNDVFGQKIENFFQNQQNIEEKIANL